MVLMQEIAAIIRNIVVIIVIATFVEIFLPRSAFNRYVKMVVGLIIILTLLLPVRKLFNIPAFPDLELEYGNMAAASGGQNLAALFPARVLAEYQEKLIGSIEKTVNEATGDKYLSRVLLTLDESDYLNPEVTDVQVVLQPVTEAAGADTEEISIDKIEIVFSEAYKQEETQGDNFLVLKKTVSEKYNIDLNLITVTVMQ